MNTIHTADEVTEYQRPEWSNAGDPEQTERVYYYIEIAALPGVYKCSGFGASEDKHRSFYLPHFQQHGNECYSKHCTHKPDSVRVVLVQGYQGDRITLNS